MFGQNGVPAAPPADERWGLFIYTTTRGIFIRCRVITFTKTTTS